MKYVLKILAAGACFVLLMAVAALAQTAPSPQSPPASTAPEALEPSGPPARALESLGQEKQVEGPVKKIDAAAKTIQVGWFLGLLRTTLEVTDGTQIHTDGMKGSLADIREGANVKAFYEVRDGKNMAKWIEVLSPPEKERAGPPTGMSGRPTPPMESSVGATLPSRGRPSTE